MLNRGQCMLLIALTIAGAVFNVFIVLWLAVSF